MPFKRINVTSSLPKNKSFTLLNSVLTPNFKFMNDTLLTGRIQDEKHLKAWINALPFASDPFKNLVYGEITESKTGIELQLKCRFGIINFIVCFFFYIPLFRLQNIDFTTILYLTMGNVIILTLLLLKFYWEANTVEKRLNEILN